MIVISPLQSTPMPPYSAIEDMLKSKNYPIKKKKKIQKLNRL